MSKSISYYDWQLGFKKKVNSIHDPIEKDEDVKLLGIPKSEFKSFLTEWKKNNLS